MIYNKKEKKTKEKVTFFLEILIKLEMCPYDRCPHLCTNDKPEYVRTDGWTRANLNAPPFSGGIKMIKR